MGLAVTNTGGTGLWRGSRIQLGSPLPNLLTCLGFLEFSSNLKILLLGVFIF